MWAQIPLPNLAKCMETKLFFFFIDSEEAIVSQKGIKKTIGVTANLYGNSA